jgi:hypothetical protein
MMTDKDPDPFNLADLLKSWEQSTEVQPPVEVMQALDRIGGILTRLCEPLGGENADLTVANMNAECTAFLIGTPWGNFAVYDNGHDDHWSGGQVMDADTIRRIPGCHQLHDVLRLHLLIVIDRTLTGMVEYLDGAPPPSKMN